MPQTSSFVSVEQAAGEGGRPEPGARMEVTFAPEKRRVEEMRRLAAAYLGRCGVRDEDALDTVKLLVSEIVTNAVRYGEGGEVGFAVSYDGEGEARIEVDDHAEGAPKVRQTGPEDEGGRGMFLVDALATAWGRTGTSTWCTVRAPRGEA
jgi:anti-sigma regulatory factor (Ser/Thr protein kinase)